VLIVVLATCQHEREFPLKLVHLYQSEMWLHFPVLALTSATRALSFRVIAKGGALVEQMLTRVNRTFPVRMFLLLVSDDFAIELASIPLCVLCAWSRTLVSEFAGHLGGQDLKAVLLMRALTWFIHIAAVESRHSAIRRIINSRSVQTHAVDMLDVSSLWLLTRMRTRAHETSAEVMCGRSRKRVQDFTNITTSVCGCPFVWGCVMCWFGFGQDTSHTCKHIERRVRVLWVRIRSQHCWWGKSNHVARHGPGSCHVE
jgi:hypothetical protein